MLRSEKKRTEKKQSRKDKKMTKLMENYPWAELTPLKNIQADRHGYLGLKEYGYMQILEVQGKDLDSLSNAEVKRTLENFLYWLSVFNDDVTFYTTKLPTDTSQQISYLESILQTVRMEIKDCRNQRRLAQLRDRERLLQNSIQIEKQIQEELYNVEFLMFVFAKTKNKLDEVVRRATTSGNQDFVPQPITLKKKIQILRQFNNMNDKV